ncbi:MAG: macro domain-containing protein [Clostridium sp.]
MMDKRVEIILGDITECNCEAIVNSAHPTLLAGSGLCGVIHRKAGRELERECLNYGGCEIGKAIVTKGYNLKNKYVIHTVAPRWYLKIEDKEELLKSCYISVLEIAKSNGIKTIAFPSIGTGIYKTPMDIGSEIAIETIKKYLKEDDFFEKVIFTLYSKNDYDIYLKKIKNSDVK